VAVIPVGDDALAGASCMALVNPMGEEVVRHHDKPVPDQRRPKKGEEEEGKGANVVDRGGLWSIVGESGGRAGF